MSDVPEVNDPPVFDGVSRLLVAAATAALAISAQNWAVNAGGTGEVPSPVQIAAIVSLSAILAGTRLPLLVRVAIHLGAIWILQQTLGEARDGRCCGLFFVSTAAFLGGSAVTGLSSFHCRSSASDDQRRKLTTGDLLAALFAFSVYVAIGQHEAAFVGEGTLRIAELAIRNVLVPYAVLLLAECLIGRMGATVALCLATGAISLTFPHLSPIDPFAVVLLAAMRIVTGPHAKTGARESARDSCSLA